VNAHASNERWATGDFTASVALLSQPGGDIGPDLRNVGVNQ
jgi:hypothetical protein